MTQRFIPDITFLLGPPADPEVLARFEAAQERPVGAGSGEERWRQLEPRLQLLLVEDEGKPTLLSELFSLVLRTPVRVVDPFLSFGRWEGRWVATLQLRPHNVRGPAHAVARLFEEGQPGEAAAAALGLAMKLDWVQTVHSLPPDDAPESARLVFDLAGEGGASSCSDRELKLTAALYASRRWVVEHVRATGALPEQIHRGGAHIGARLLVDRRGTDIVLTDDERLVHEAIVREGRLPGGAVRLALDW